MNPISLRLRTILTFYYIGLIFTTASFNFVKAQTSTEDGKFKLRQFFWICLDLIWQ